MYRILRRMLIASLLLFAYVVALMVYLVPHAWLVILGVGAFMLCQQKRQHYTAYGSAKFAELEDLEGMIDE
jgi:hypothetical protein